MKTPNNRIPRWKIRMFWIMLLSAAVLGTAEWFNRSRFLADFLRSPSPADNFAREEALRLNFYRVLFDFGIRVDWITGSSNSKTVLIPGDLPMEAPFVALVAKFRELDGRVIEAETNPTYDRMSMKVGLTEIPLFEITLLKDPELRRNAGKIAIVIDDFGYSFNETVKGFLSLNQEITLAILPGLKYSGEIAWAAVEAKHQGLLHLPMEAKNDEVGFNGYTLHTKLTRDEIRVRLKKSINAVPNIVGISNHMGSKATEDAELLKVMMPEIKENGLLFLDSHTDAGTLAYTEAKKNGIPCALNNTFLDAIPEAPFIKEQLYLLAEIASRRGSAVGIGHPKALTLKVLEKELPELAKRGYQFVGIQDVVSRGGEVTLK